MPCPVKCITFLDFDTKVIHFALYNPAECRWILKLDILRFPIAKLTFQQTGNRVQKTLALPNQLRHFFYFWLRTRPFARTGQAFADRDPRDAIKTIKSKENLRFWVPLWAHFGHKVRSKLPNQGVGVGRAEEYEVFPTLADSAKNGFLPCAALRAACCFHCPVYVISISVNCPGKHFFAPGQRCWRRGGFDMI